MYQAIKPAEIMGVQEAWATEMVLIYKYFRLNTLNPLCGFDIVPLLCSWKCTVPSGDGTSVIKDLQRQECEPLF